MASERCDIPDPTSDLDWSGFRGAIHDLFAQNAAAHPDRICVVETKSESSLKRQFTYRIINESSNVLAHYLIASGIERGDVVMVYAYRGVDLVVAVVGVLKAGATFSVIDPAYPPERQKIYLEVAQPRALINIEKATIEAGQLSQVVRSYIDNKLKLKAEIPSLRINDDGFLFGGSINGKDVLDPQRPRASISPGILVGPDSIPTLSFTSGSEGRPKGVCGRHFSLAYYFPWMQERFELSSKDRFTLLSGIAHDPIQRDIFTPLFLGAQLLVPSKEDIQHERLAEWMQRYEATITHLTPAMGQILVGGATAQFPALRRAFFVGDVLTKRDCNLLRNLARNVNIINLYGTTETQRAVSYFEIPSFTTAPSFLDQMKGIIPAGRGMKNVQLLVVNRTDRTKLCAIGEIGVIYVRAGGLAEGYLRDLGLSKDKFVQNWFTDAAKWISEDEKRTQSRSKVEPWRKPYDGPPGRELYKGIRDRLYKTGDLGTYLPTGDVEYTGRADDQVKIRGFRIELGDINSHLSQHPLIRDSVTLVRRDKYEEATLVSYIVPELKTWPDWLRARGLQEKEEDEGMTGMLRRFRPLQDEVRLHLKGKLPYYAIPTHFIPLKKLPLNPNGKVDKPALPFPDIIEVTAAASQESLEMWNSLSDNQRLVATAWSDLIPGCNAKTIRLEDSFFDIGGHSILAQRMLIDMRKVHGVQVPMASLFRDPTLRGFSQEINRAKGICINGEGNGKVNGNSESEAIYAEDAEKLLSELPKSFPSASQLDGLRQLTVFLTGASGFLGAYLLRDLLSRRSPSVRVIAHVRAKTSEAAFKRLVNSCTAYGLWSASWTSRLSCVTGNLGEPRLGLDIQTWSMLSEEVDVVIHNGAQVHWVYPYSKLKVANVQGTVDALLLCSIGKPKQFAFVSSTSVLDSEHYVRLSEKSTAGGGTGVLEVDDLEGSRTGLGTGYGQSKWVGEYLVRAAGKRGLSGTIIRPGYILGDSGSGVTNTDDFLIRMLKGCIQLSSRPRITNTVNMVPVDHVARVVVASAFHPQYSVLGVVQVTSYRRLQFNEYLSALEHYGYTCPEVDYQTWKVSLEEYVSDGGVQKDHAQLALMPLYHFVTNDLPTNTKASELDDRNAAAALKVDAQWTGHDYSSGSAVTIKHIGRYIRYLTITGFLPPPAQENGLPDLLVEDGQRDALQYIGGRGGATR